MKVRSQFKYAAIFAIISKFTKVTGANRDNLETHSLNQPIAKQWNSSISSDRGLYP